MSSSNHKPLPTPVEEEEELDTIPVTTSLKRTAQSEQGDARSAGPPTWNAPADEFDLAIDYVPASKRAKTVGKVSSVASSLSKGAHAHACRAAGDSGDPVDTVEKEEGIAMDKDISSTALPDDTDFAGDEKEYGLWRERRAQLAVKLKSAPQ